MKTSNSWYVCAAVVCCAATHTTAVAQSRRAKPVIVPGIELAIDASGLKSLEAPPTQASNIDGAAVAAGSQAAAATPGYTPAAGAAGTLLGVLIVKSLNDSSVRRAANKPIEPLRAQYAAHWNTLALETSLQDSWHEHALENQRCSSDATTKCEARLTVRPELLMLAGGRIFSLSMEAKLQDQKGHPLYTTRLNYLSEPASGTQAEVNDFWSRDDFQALRKQWTAALQTLVPLLASAMDGRETHPSGVGQAIRYANAAGIFYERGVILSQNDHLVTYRSLDGGISVVYVERMLGTGEYYEWLTAPRAADSSVAIEPTSVASPQQ